MAAGERTLILAEGFSADRHYGKTMHGLLRYRREDVVAILDSARAGEHEAGVPIVGDVDTALAFDPQVALVGVATQGGRFPPAWRALLRTCIEHGLAIENGLHEMLADDPELRPLADRVGVELRDLRRPPAGLDCATGANLEVDARIVLTVGSDCAIGKMTVSLELDRAAQARGIASVFVPTGQTGIAIAGWGMAVDAVVADFLAGAAEQLVVEGRRRGGELLFVEGPGLARAPGVLRGHTRSLPRVGAARPRPLPSRRLDGDRGLPRSSDPAAHGSRPAARARVAPATAGAGRRGRREHRGPGRRRRPYGNRRGGGSDRAARLRPGARRCGHPPRRRARVVLVML